MLIAVQNVLCYSSPTHLPRLSYTHSSLFIDSWHQIWRWPSSRPWQPGAECTLRLASEEMLVKLLFSIPVYVSTQLSSSLSSYVEINFCSAMSVSALRFLQYSLDFGLYCQVSMLQSSWQLSQLVKIFFPVELDC